MAMQLINVHKLTKSFANKILFKDLSFGIDDKERVGLIGPNGAGKSTLLKILAGQAEADGGQVTRKKGLRLGFLEQTPQFTGDLGLLDTIISKCPSPEDSFAKAYELMGLMGLFQFGEEFSVKKMSGGWQKRVALARELILEPELLILDEPTNHLDVESILWLEDYLAGAQCSVLMVTHDRLFLQRVANRILDLDPRNPNYLLSVKGDYSQFLEAKAHERHALERQEQVLKNTLRRETEWLRRGAKARQTKQTARIEAAGDLADNVRDLEAKNRHQKVEIDFGELEKSPKKLIEAINISKSYGERVLFKNLDLIISPKTRLALLGHNGSGKSTLIRVLLGQEPPDQGTVRIGATTSSIASDIRISYFEQSRETLKPEVSVFRNICPDGDFVHFRGTPIHARSYLDRFLFRGNKVDLPVMKLSGGEQARLRIAQLMLKDAQILVLDEPTNDLDSDTLDILESALSEFNGAVILVTHDRYFMDAVANQILAFHPDEHPNRNLVKFASYMQWEEWFTNLSKNPEKPTATTSTPTPSPQTGPTKEVSPPGIKLSFKEKFELENMEKTIHELEATAEKLLKESENTDLNKTSQKLSEILSELANVQSEIEKMYARWAELEKRASL